ncbi:uncharacterized protein LOC142657478 [Rhinoderma darwinii]|uniref:uncharacterized protein LOC142657478 n=1 Tax=Rhinoderma darwinii TaxID=43563 RepID=UPI003F67B03C
METCKFKIGSVVFLNYIISPHEFSIDPFKVQAIKDLALCTNLKAVQRFLGFANYYRRFSRTFSSIVASITALTKTGANPAKWSPDVLKAFSTLKMLFSLGPILRYPDIDVQFIVANDSFNVGAADILLRENAEDHTLRLLILKDFCS